MFSVPVFSSQWLGFERQEESPTSGLFTQPWVCSCQAMFKQRGSQRLGTACDFCEKTAVGLAWEMLLYVAVDILIGPEA